MSDQKPEDLQHEIEAQRAQLADTVDALGHKLDVKAQAGAQVNALQDRATTETGRPRPELIAGAAGAVGLVVALLWLRRRRQH